MSVPSEPLAFRPGRIGIAWTRKPGDLPSDFNLFGRGGPGSFRLETICSFTLSVFVVIAGRITAGRAAIEMQADDDQKNRTSHRA